MALSTTLAQRAIARAAFKGLLRTARRVDSLICPADVRKEVVSISAVLSPTIASAVLTATTPSPSSMTAAIRDGFRAGAACAPIVGLSSTLDAALSALSVANKRAAVSSPSSSPKSSVSSSVLSVGQVIRHKTLGYRGVIVGRDETCKASIKWMESTGVARLPRGASQPFFHVLVDLRDRPSPQISYVAMDNLTVLSGAEGSLPADLVVIHPLLPRYFDSFAHATGAYQPSITAARLARASSQRHTSATAAAAVLA